MATPKTDAQGKIVKPDAEGTRSAGRSLAAMLDSPDMRREIARALPSTLSPDRMVRITMTALRTTPKLAICTVESFFGSVLQASQLGLEVNTPLQHAWLIPRRSKYLSSKAGRDVYECTLQIGYQGEIELSRRSGLVTAIRARAVRQGDHFVYSDGLYPRLEHTRSEAADREQALLTHAYAIAVLKNEQREFEVLTRAQIEDRRRRSAAASGDRGSPWDTDFEAMACKSAVRALWKWLPKSPEMAAAERLEVASDMGRSQLRAVDPDVQDGLDRVGLNAIPDNDEQIAWDPDTGEVIEGQAEQQPANESGRHAGDA